MAASGHTFVVVCAKTEPGMQDEEVFEGIRIYNIDTLPQTLLRRLNPKFRFYLSRYLYYPRAIQKLGRLLRAIQFDVWRDDIAPFPLVGAHVLAGRHGIPLIGTVHNLSGSWRQWCSFYGMGAGTTGYLGETFLRKAQPYAMVVSDSRWMKEALAGDLGKDRVVWIPNGVDIERFRPGRCAHSVGVHFLYAGRFIPLKGHTILLEAFAQVVRAAPNVRLHLAGEGPEKLSCERLIRELELQDYVVLHGNVPKDKMPALYQEMDAYVSPSLFEGLPVTFLEAMASGLPIVSTRILAVEGILTDAESLLVDMNSPQALANAILHLSGNAAERSRMGANGRVRVEQHFTWDRVVDAELAVFEQAVSRAHQTPQGRS